MLWKGRGVMPSDLRLGSGITWMTMAVPYRNDIRTADTDKGPNWTHPVRNTDSAALSLLYAMQQYSPQ